MGTAERERIKLSDIENNAAAAQDALASETVGSILREQRLKLGLTIDDLSRKLYIRATYLDAIEHGSYHVVGDPVYVKGFIRNYAEGLGLSGDALVRQYNRENRGTSADAGARISRRKKPVYETPEVTDIGPRHTGKRPFNKLEWGIIFTVIGLIALFWIWLLYL